MKDVPSQLIAMVEKKIAERNAIDEELAALERLLKGEQGPPAFAALPPARRSATPRDETKRPAAPRKAPPMRKGDTPQADQVFEFIRGQGRAVRLMEIQQGIGLSAGSAYSACRTLQKRGRVKRTGIDSKLWAVTTPAAPKASKAPEFDVVWDGSKDGPQKPVERARATT